MTQEEIVKTVQKESSDIQTKFIMQLVGLCEEYGVKKTEFIRDTISELNEFASNTDFDKLKV